MARFDDVRAHRRDLQDQIDEEYRYDLERLRRRYSDAWNRTIRGRAAAPLLLQAARQEGAACKSPLYG